MFRIAITTTALIISVAVSASAGNKKTTTSPVTSSELLEFIGKSDQKMIDFGKTSDFIGVITRVHEQGQLRNVDLYEIKNIEATSMSKELCEKILAKMFGPLDKISLKVKKIDVFTSHTGKTCDAQLDDEDLEAKIPERRVIAGFLNAKPIALTFKLSKKSSVGMAANAGSAKQPENVRKFWDTLR